MDRNRFDALARALAVLSTRRSALSLAGALGLSNLLGTDARKKRCKRTCPVCRRCKKGRCKPTPNGTPCGPGTCQDGECACPTECCSDQDCAGGAGCLGNGSCALVCAESVDCPAGCSCGFPSAEGPQRCHANVTPSGPSCPEFPECSSTINCLEGQHCQETGCSGNPNRCIPLCPL